MKELALHILDIVENSTRAGATRVVIRVIEDLKADRLTIEITDNGSGMDGETIKNALKPFYTTKKVRKVGIGLPLLNQAAARADGEMTIHSMPGEGATVKAVFVHSHIDRQPLGDLGKTITAILMSAPDLHLVFEHIVDDEHFVFDSDAVREILNEVPITDPEVLMFIEAMVRERKNLE